MMNSLFIKGMGVVPNVDRWKTKEDLEEDISQFEAIIAYERFTNAVAIAAALNMMDELWKQRQP